MALFLIWPIFLLDNLLQLETSGHKICNIMVMQALWTVALLFFHRIDRVLEISDRRE
jgi:hypothetical protein